MNQMPFLQSTHEERRARLAGHLDQVDDAIGECFHYGKDEPPYTADLKLRYRLAGARLVRTSLDVMKALEAGGHRAADTAADPVGGPAE